MATPTVADAISDLPPAVPVDETPLVPNHIDVTPKRDRERISYVPEGSWLSKVADAPPGHNPETHPERHDKVPTPGQKFPVPHATLRRGVVPPLGRSLHHTTRGRSVTGIP